MTQATFLRYYYSTWTPVTPIHILHCEKMLSDVRQIEFLLHALQVGLRSLFDLVNLWSSSLNLALVAQAVVKEN